MNKCDPLNRQREETGDNMQNNNEILRTAADELEMLQMGLETVASALDRLNFDLEEGRDFLKEEGAEKLTRSAWFQKVLPGDAAIFSMAAMAVADLIDQAERSADRLRAHIGAE